MHLFRDRQDAGRRLAGRLASLAAERPVVVALPRGGVPVGFEVARALGAPLDVLVVRKLGAPGHAELGMGAVAEGGLRVLNEDVLGSLRVSDEELEHATTTARRELDERVARYAGTRPRPQLAGRTVVLVDDGLATGGTARVAGRALRARDPARLVLAVPVGSPDTVAALDEEFDEVVCLAAPDPLWAIGTWYEHFGQTSDDEVADLLARAAAPSQAGVEIPLREGGAIAGDLTLPGRPRGLVLFAHGSGSSRHSPRNREVAAALNAAGMATLLIDLLTPREEQRRANVFDIELLAGRLLAAMALVRGRADIGGLDLGLFGASTGAAAALCAAAAGGDQVRAVVSRGGRPDLAGPWLADVRAPTLLVVGGHDEAVIELNRAALARLRCPAELEIVPGAGHLFEEPGTLEVVERLATDWFAAHLGVGVSAG